MNQLHEAVLCRYIKVIKILFQGSAINVEFIKQSNMHKIWLHILDILLEATLPSLKEMYNEKMSKEQHFKCSATLSYAWYRICTARIQEKKRVTNSY